MLKLKSDENVHASAKRTRTPAVETADKTQGRNLRPKLHTDMWFHVGPEPILRSKVKEAVGSIHDYFQNYRKTRAHGGKSVLVLLCCK